MFDIRDDALAIVKMIRNVAKEIHNRARMRTSTCFSDALATTLARSSPPTSSSAPTTATRRAPTDIWRLILSAMLRQMDVTGWVRRRCSFDIKYDFGKKNSIQARGNFRRLG